MHARQTDTCRARSRIGIAAAGLKLKTSPTQNVRRGAPAHAHLRIRPWTVGAHARRTAAAARTCG